MEKHDLYDFFQKANDDIEKEYLRISRNAKEDPGTAGDQGEENWKGILEQWIPPYYHIETKGRILFENGETSPQVDVIVLSPEYPKQLWGCKRFLSGGVVAAFECKITLKREHIKDIMETARFIREQSRKEHGTPKKDLHNGIYYGLLAHSHEWKKDNSNPKENILNAIHEFSVKVIDHPIQLPDIICVADLAVWKRMTVILPRQKDTETPRFNHNHIETGYMELADDYKNTFYTPVGAMIFGLLDYLAWKNEGLREIVSYMRRINISGAGEGEFREWDFGFFSEDTIENFKTNNLINGGFWNEWNMIF